MLCAIHKREGLRTCLKGGTPSTLSHLIDVSVVMSVTVIISPVLELWSLFRLPLSRLLINQ